MGEELGKVLHDMIHKDKGWPFYWEDLHESAKQRFRDAAFAFAAYIGEEIEDE